MIHIFFFVSEKERTVSIDENRFLHLNQFQITTVLFVVVLFFLFRRLWEGTDVNYANTLDLSFN